MLVLTRKCGEKIHIGPDIVLTVLELKGNKVRLGIEAPQDVIVFRAELHDFLDKASNMPEPQLQR